MRLPTREEAQVLADIYDENSSQNLIFQGYADGELLSRAEWEATIKDNPVIDMGDDNLWVMVDLGNPGAAVGEEKP